MDSKAPHRVVEPEGLPLGAPVTDSRPAPPPRRQTYDGSFVRLTPVDPAEDVDQLYGGSHGDAATEALWAYMPYGPFADKFAMRAWLERCAASEDPLFLTVSSQESGRRIGMVSFLNFVAASRVVELGHIWYQPSAQRGRSNTESVFLMLCEAFEFQRCRRVEWKCNALNARSRAAALRLGFSFEGVFRQHLVVKGRNRDSAWFSMLDAEWPRVKANMSRWLYDNDGSLSLRDLNAEIVSGSAA
ncbi:MAG: GNAT family protein [Gammaproteobacteria bacterium]|nr:GNAT family protein [Gammaproteobacteria bacterium]